MIFERSPPQFSEGSKLCLIYFNALKRNSNHEIRTLKIFFILTYKIDLIQVVTVQRLKHMRYYTKPWASWLFIMNYKLVSEWIKSYWVLFPLLAC